MKVVDDEEVLGIVEEELDNQLKGELVRKKVIYYYVDY
jgi:hypothetical protein